MPLPKIAFMAMAMAITPPVAFQVYRSYQGVSPIVVSGGKISCPTCGTGSGAVTSVTAGNSTLTVTPTTGAVIASLNLANSNVWTANGAASSSADTWNGSWFTGGTGTTTFPYWLIQPTGVTAVTTWSTGGTAIGINAPSGFAGNFLDFRINGGPYALQFTSGGSFNLAGTINASAFITGGFDVTSGSGFGFRYGNTRARSTSPADGQIKFTNAAQTAGAQLQAEGIAGTSAAPAIAVGAGAGSSPGTPTATGTDMSGVVTVITGTATTANAILATITYAVTQQSAPQVCVLQPRNAAAAAAYTTTITTAPSTTIWTVNSGTTALTVSTTYIWGYHCF